MPTSFERLLEKAACDGADSLRLFDNCSSAGEVTALFEAWAQERHENIEARLLLARATKLLARILQEEEVSSQNQRRANTLIRAIHAISTENS